MTSRLSLGKNEPKYRLKPTLDSTMNKKERNLEEFRTLKGSDYSVVEELTLHQQLPDGWNTYELRVDLTLRNRDDSEGRLALSFSKVRNFRFNPRGSELYFSLLTILPVNDGWEDVNYKVFNAEQDVEFSFFCNDFTVTRAT
ncbi:MAG: hypothetical protein K1X52_02005 [Pyrinomonadaceae bacterium]|nr:hypothetical protein [Pyrinomonadaceae bacterium]